MAFKDRLPTGSQYRGAVLMDRELAADHLDAEEAAGAEHDDEMPSNPRPEGYTLDTYMLMGIIDALHGVQATIIAAAGSDPPTMRSLPRPMAAIEILREERRTASMQTLIDLFSPPPVPETPGVPIDEHEDVDDSAW